MKRSRTQTLFKYLPDAMFVHGDGFVALVHEVEGRNFEADVNAEVVLEEVEREAGRWPSERRQLSLPSELGSQSFKFVEPTNVRWDLFPLVFACRNPQCRAVRTFRRSDEVSEQTHGRARCGFCNSRLQQLRYVEAHNCGRLEPLFAPECRTCNSRDRVYLRDTGSFVSSAWHCRRCADQFVQKTRQRPCRCGDFAGASGRPFMRGFVARDHRLHRTLTVTVINLNHREYSELKRHPSRGEITVAHYLGDVADIGAALRDADRAADGASPVTAADFDAKKARWDKALEGGLLSQDEYDELIETHQPKTRGVAAIASQVPQRVLELGAERGLTERAVLFDREILPDRRPLASAAADAAAAGKTLDAAAMESAIEQAARLGIEEVSVTLSFPITLAAYGYTRIGTTPENASLRGFEYRRNPTIYGTATTTEAIIVTLSAQKIVSWLASEGHIPSADVATNERDARVQLLEIHANRDSAAEHARVLVHSFSHAMLRGMGSGLSGFDESGLSEWVVPEAATFAIYAASYQTFTLGALWTVMHHQSHELLEATEERARTCANDPLCHRRGDEACERCLYVTFGCRHWNAELSRRALRSFWRHTNTP